MLDYLPVYIPLVFGLTTLTTFVLFFGAMKNSTSAPIRQNAIWIAIGLYFWLLIQAVLTLQNVYKAYPEALPPKIFVFGILPIALVIIALFITKKGRVFIDSLPLANLTYLNVVRIPVEIVLYWLFLYKAIPELMTFEGRNFDIMAGLTAPVIAYWFFTKEKLSKRVLLYWNIICLGLLLNIVGNALLSAPSPLQKFAFEQPNIAVLNFPFSWLPTFVVPVVLFGHLVSIRRLTK